MTKSTNAPNIIIDDKVKMPAVKIIFITREPTGESVKGSIVGAVNTFVQNKIKATMQELF